MRFSVWFIDPVAGQKTLQNFVIAKDLASLKSMWQKYAALQQTNKAAVTVNGFTGWPKLVDDGGQVQILPEDPADFRLRQLPYP